MAPVPVDLAALEDAIISACAYHERDHRSEYYYRLCLAIEGVKFDSYQSL